MVYSIVRQSLSVQEKTPNVLLFIDGSPRSVWIMNRTSHATLADLHVTRLEWTRRYSFLVAACSVARDIRDISRKNKRLLFATCWNLLY